MSKEIKVGSLVKVIDGSYAVRVDKYEKYTGIGHCKNTFEVLQVDILGPSLSNSMGIPVHDIFIKNTVNGRIYLHSSIMVSKFKCPYCNK